MNILKAIDGFQIARLAEGYAPVTLSSYKSSLRTLAEYLEDPEISSITPDDLQSFMHYLHTEYIPERKSGSTKPLATASFHRYWKAIRSFFKWASNEFNFPRPDLSLKMPSYNHREVVPLTEEEIKKLLKACDHAKPVVDGKRRPYQCKCPSALRDRALILFLLDTGVRAGECARVCIKDVDLEKGEIHIHPFHVQKTKPRTVYLGKSARKAIWKYQSSRENPYPEDPLFITTQGRPMTNESIRSVLYGVASTAGVSNVHPHKFRHTFAIQYLRNGGDVFTLQRLLGHSSLEMVRRYLALSDSDAASAHHSASPADRWHL